VSHKPLCGTSASLANAPKELEAFSFLIGKWEGVGKTKLADGRSAEFAVSWIGRYILDGTVIAES
jgi:hypothetical protein